MPIFRLYSIFDVKAANFSPPMVFENKLVAIRFFTDELGSPNSRMSKHAEDYDLREIGAFDSDSGAVTPHPAPIAIITAADCVAKSNSKVN